MPSKTFSKKEGAFKNKKKKGGNTAKPNIGKFEIKSWFEGKIAKMYLQKKEGSQKKLPSKQEKKEGALKV